MTFSFFPRTWKNMDDMFNLFWTSLKKFITKNLVLCNHPICDYIQLFVICKQCFIILQLLPIFLIDYS
jgi:hypothetical protein